jgi:energy-coupling factor transporter ATP-binding protein EcfA2
MAKERKHSETAYQKHREGAARRARLESAGAREIGAIPACANPDRRKACESDLQLALETYFADLFPHAWSYQHIEVIDCLYQTLKHGGLFALGMPRGSGKTTLAECAAILAMLYGWRHYLVMIGAVQEAASESLDRIKVQFETNELLLEDFPEVCYPIRCLEGEAKRTAGQTCEGEKTRIHWSGRKFILLPTIPGSIASGGKIQAAGLCTRIRGMNHLTVEGKSVRPDAFLGDDLQTDQSAKVVTQVERRETLLNGAVLGLAGPGERIAGLATLTIVRKGDLADRLLDRRQNPHWQGKTFSLVEKWPDNLEHWEHYAELREQDLRAGNTELPTATAYYRKHRKAMDAGAVVPWAARREPHELSALQNAFNLKLANPATFEAEYQNQPTLSNTAIGAIACPQSDDIVLRVNGYKRHEIPRDATRLYCATDVQQDVLFYLILALAEDFTGWIIDYGAYPEQPLGNYWTLKQLQISLRMATQSADIETAWFKGLNKLLNTIAARQYIRDDGAKMAVDGYIIDANYGNSTQTVYEVCRQSIFNPLPFHGKGVTARQPSLAERKKKVGERAGAEWFMPATKGTRTPRHVIADTNVIKSMLAQRLTIEPSARSAWTLFQSSIAGHRMLADHLSAEYPIETEGRGRKLHEWTEIPGRDNHYLDCCVMAATLGLMAGCVPGVQRVGSKPKQPGKSLAQLRAEAMAKKK